MALIANPKIGRCGRYSHWTQIEHTERCVRLVGDFLAEPDARGQ